MVAQPDNGFGDWKVLLDLTTHGAKNAVPVVGRPTGQAIIANIQAAERLKAEIERRNAAQQAADEAIVNQEVEQEEEAIDQYDHLIDQAKEVYAKLIEDLDAIKDHIDREKGFFQDLVTKERVEIKLQRALGEQLRVIDQTKGFVRTALAQQRSHAAAMRKVDKARLGMTGPDRRAVDANTILRQAKERITQALDKIEDLVKTEKAMDRRQVRIMRRTIAEQRKTRQLILAVQRVADFVVSDTSSPVYDDGMELQQVLIQGLQHITDEDAQLMKAINEVGAIMRTREELLTGEYDQAMRNVKGIANTLTIGEQMAQEIDRIIEILTPLLKRFIEAERKASRILSESEAEFDKGLRTMDELEAAAKKVKDKLEQVHGPGGPSEGALRTMLRNLFGGSST